MFTRLKNSVSKAAGEAAKVVDELGKAAPKIINDACNEMSGVKPREATYSGAVRLRNDLPEEINVKFRRCKASDIFSSVLLEENVAPGAECSFDAGCIASLSDPGGDFDYIASVFVPGGNTTSSHHVLRGAAYSFRLEKAGESKQQNQYSLQPLSVPERSCSDKLASVQGLSFAFSASGWLFIYQMGVAECLQNHGITRNPHVRLVGASGGALTAVAMMYGADMRNLKEFVKSCASATHKDVSQAMNLRYFVLEAMKQFARDGSFLHPIFQSQRVEVAISEAQTGVNMALSALAMQTKASRLKDFADTSEIAVAMLASSSMGISGLPFEMETADGQKKKVADGGITQFLPKIDENSISVKPFSDALNLMSGGGADVCPTEWVPGSCGLYPGSVEFVDHLYEMGYQDMEAWLNKNLASRLEKCSGANPGYPSNGPDSQPVPPFVCPNDGMAWYDTVLQKVPVAWADQKDPKFLEKQAAARSAGAAASSNASAA